MVRRTIEDTMSPSSDGTGREEFSALVIPMTIKISAHGDNWPEVVALLTAKATLWFDGAYRAVGGRGFDLSDQDVKVERVLGGFVLLTCRFVPPDPDPAWPEQQRKIMQMWFDECRGARDDVQARVQNKPSAEDTPPPGALRG
jgi:hypothetical protein